MPFLPRNDHTKTKSQRNTKIYKDILKGKRLVVLGIPDDYDYMYKDLIKLLKLIAPRLVQL